MARQLHETGQVDMGSAEGVRHVDLRARFGAALEALPFSFRILAEGALRHGDDEAASALERWAESGSTAAEIRFRPARVLMHDTTAVPALVDIAAMRDVLAEHGHDPRRLAPKCPVDVSIDHSVAIDRFGTVDSMAWNMRVEIERNRERYAFLKWAGKALDDFRVFPPGTGILHTINMEYLATVIARVHRDGHPWAVPDTLIGTDSHTPMINALGVLAWGVGGLEAESAMFGLPVAIAVPDVVGVRLTGSMPQIATATDLALAVTERLRGFGVVGCFVEFFGPGVAGLDVGTRAAVANMAPEYGATTGYFPIDAQTIAYLRANGRGESHARFVEDHARRLALWNDGAASPRYSTVVEIDLSGITSVVAGPTRPQDRMSLDEVPIRLGLDEADTVSGKSIAAPVALAAITSCTNTADPRLLIAAGLMARKAKDRGMTPPEWVKTSFAPGSAVALHYLRRAGLLEPLVSIGFAATGIGCTVCIGNSGPLAPAMEARLAEGGGSPIAVISGNRNFPGRVHSRVEKALLASPPLVVAYALAGRADIQISCGPIGVDTAGRPVHLRDLWPSAAEIDVAVAAALDAGDVREAYANLDGDTNWQAVEAPAGDLFPWQEASTYLRRPPFVRAGAKREPALADLRPLAVFGDDVTTDDISPAGAISSASAAARYLVEQGAEPGNLNVYASRRGNFEVMTRGAFTNRTLRNRLVPDAPAGMTLLGGDSEPVSIREAAARSEEMRRGLFIVAGERYGAGSSRDWAAKAPALLGVRAVCASSFERIHRSNLVNMGIAPVVLPAGWHPDNLGWRPEDTLDIELPEGLGRRCRARLTVSRSDGRTLTAETEILVETAQEVEVLAAGGLMPFILDAAIGEENSLEKKEA